MKLLITNFLFLFSFALNAQTVIQMVEFNGVYTISCEVNGLKSRMIFDTGASKVSLSNSFCEILLDNGYLKMSDFAGEGKSLMADGRIIANTELTLRSVKIGDVVLKNVPAVVIYNQDAPLLFGQSAIQMLGEVSIKGDKLYIKDGNGISQKTSSNTHSEKWDAEHYSYSNYTYGFGWDLPMDFEWERVDGQEKHSVFRAEGMPFVIFVNAQVATKEKDLWTVYEQYAEMMEQLDLQLEKKQG